MHVIADVEIPTNAALLRDWLAPRRRVFVLTGAGCSTASGIPDYRDEAGGWKRKPPVTFQAFTQDDTTRRRYWARSFAGWPVFSQAAPNAAHRAMAAWEATGRMSMLLTQNVDGLHHRAGNAHVVDLHGRLDTVRCLACGDLTPRDTMQHRLADANPGWIDTITAFAPDGDADLERVDFSDFDIPSCTRCGGMLKPDVVFFGENVPRARFEIARDALAASDALLVVGSSLMVYSGFRFARMAHEAGLPIALLTRGATRADELATLAVRADCTKVLPEALV
ncbi:NAD-dependent protein deacetylase [Lysobacter sp. TY2-98]|uniref:NAD-dependent protein deacetylase n=1 Tax=Lysobacter sp. TY2-98 TaxID=2290922 RepID=UPI000E1FD125|nr:NAD-dependent protein deacetylase [Lysobacter sp. TY2-98]AXK72078.1 NAD-dependent protein deacetylase [Lysobacter sp. TY2-98]